DDADANRVIRGDFGVDVPFVIPFRLDAAFATGKEHKDADSVNHTLAKLSWQDYQLLNRVTWDFSAELIRGAEIRKDKYWNDVTEWELKDKTTFDTTLAWRPWDPLTIYGGYKNVQTDRDKTKDPSAPYDRKTESIVTAGLDYGI